MPKRKSPTKRNIAKAKNDRDRAPAGSSPVSASPPDSGSLPSSDEVKPDVSLRPQTRSFKSSTRGSKVKVIFSPDPDPNSSSSITDYDLDLHTRGYMRNGPPSDDDDLAPPQKSSPSSAPMETEPSDPGSLASTPSDDSTSPTPVTTSTTSSDAPGSLTHSDSNSSTFAATLAQDLRNVPGALSSPTPPAGPWPPNIDPSLRPSPVQWTEDSDFLLEVINIALGRKSAPESHWTSSDEAMSSLLASTAEALSPLISKIKDRGHVSWPFTDHSPPFPSPWLPCS